MRPLLFVYSHDHIFQAVKQESSLHAERKENKDGDSLFEQLVFDEEYLTKFRELFFDAQSEIALLLSAYMRDVPASGECVDLQDFSDSKDYIVLLAMPCSWNYHLTNPLKVKIKQCLVAYIMYRWLETKIPDEAAVFKTRFDFEANEVKKIINVRVRPVRRDHGYY